ncbi:MAG: S4 domain-containing protein [Acidobacteriia bacterium]|nr:S4 domain-containing protein [Terriglobia bacterium]
MKPAETSPHSTGRLDLFLKWSGLVRRRSLAKWLCDRGAVRVNGLVARAGRPVGCGDRIRMPRNHRWIEVEVLRLPPQLASPAERRRRIFEEVEIFRILSESPRTEEHNSPSGEFSSLD